MAARRRYNIKFRTYNQGVVRTLNDVVPIFEYYIEKDFGLGLVLNYQKVVCWCSGETRHQSTRPLTWSQPFPLHNHHHAAPHLPNNPYPVTEFTAVGYQQMTSNFLDQVQREVPNQTPYVFPPSFSAAGPQHLGQANSLLPQQHWVNNVQLNLGTNWQLCSQNCINAGGTRYARTPLGTPPQTPNTIEPWVRYACTVLIQQDLQNAHGYWKTFIMDGTDMYNGLELGAQVAPPPPADIPDVPNELLDDLLPIPPDVPEDANGSTDNGGLAGAGVQSKYVHLLPSSRKQKRGAPTNRRGRNAEPSRHQIQKKKHRKQKCRETDESQSKCVPSFFQTRTRAKKMTTEQLKNSVFSAWI